MNQLEEEAIDAGAQLISVASAGLTPCVTILADMARTKDKAQRAALLHKVEQAVVNGASEVCGPHGQAVRSVYFRAHQQTMSQSAYSGTAAPSARTFINRASDEAGKAAWRAAKTGKANLYADLSQQRPIGFTPSATTNYQTFLTVGVVHEGKLYGMLNVDAPKSGQLGETDLAVAGLLARLLAVGNALVDA